MPNQTLKIAVQKSGRLSEESVNLLRRCGVKFDNGSGKLKSAAQNFPLEIFFLRDDDIPQYVADGVADAGIVGQNVLQEQNYRLETAETLGFGKCRLSLAVPKSFPYQAAADLSGKKIATSYPNILTRFFEQKGIAAEIHHISGSVEIAPSIGLADAICDLVSSGSTLFSNNLREVETILYSEAVFVARPQLDPELQAIFDKLMFRVRAVKAAKHNKYILLNAPNDQLDEITRVLPGIKSPTVMPLAVEGWSSVHSVIDENDFWEVVEQLRDKGAEGILVLSIDQMIQ